jgi:hypothetical protein
VLPAGLRLVLLLPLRLVLLVLPGAAADEIPVTRRSCSRTGRCNQRKPFSKET